VRTGWVGKLLIYLSGKGKRAERRVSRRVCEVVLSWMRNGDNMIRTQISLDEREYELAKEAARALGVSVAEFVRRAVRDALPSDAEKPWMRFAGLVETGDPRSSQSIDDIVYGQKD
jgi:hypothetical protein